MSRHKSLEQRESSEIQIRLQKAFNGMSVSDIARQLGEKPSSFWNWASGRNEFPHDVLAKIARLNISTHWILTGEGNPILESKLPSFEESVEAKIRTTVLELLEDDSGVDARKIRDIIRGIIKEEIASQSSRLLLPMDVGDADDKTARKTG